jgi:hypothetical protein
MGGCGEEGFNRGEDNGASRGDPPIGRYLGVVVPEVGRKRGDDGNDLAPEPLLTWPLSNADKKDLVPDELLRECSKEDRLDDGGFSRKIAL